MRKYLLDNVIKCFSTIIYVRYGSVAVASVNDEKQLRLVAYGLPSAEINKLEPKERSQHIIVDEICDISDVDYNDEMSVFRKTHDLVIALEMHFRWHDAGRDAGYIFR